MYAYVTRDRVKAFALVNALIDAEFEVIIYSHNHHYDIQTTADEAQFKVARASINIPSSNPSPDMPNPNTVVIPNTIPSGWDKI